MLQVMQARPSLMPLKLCRQLLRVTHTCLTHVVSLTCITQRGPGGPSVFMARVTGVSMAFYSRVKFILDQLYTAGGVLGALFLIAILCLIVVQMLARWFGWNVEIIRGAPDYAGYSMAAASFLSFAYALNRGAHIRVSLLLAVLGRFRYYGELWCFAIGAAASTYLAGYAIKATRWSLKLNDISQGLDATPLWIPQLAMCVGAVLLALCFWDNLVRLLVDKEHAIQTEKVQNH